MMFSLAIPTEPRWLDLPHGVKVQVRPLDGLVLTAARNHAKAAVLAMMKERADLLAANVPAVHIPDLADDAMREAMIQFELARGLARFGVIDFRGVGDDDDNPLPFSTAQAEALVVHPAMLEPFLDAYTAPLARVAHEGNGSTPAQHGSMGAGETIAAGAATSPVPSARLN